MKYLILEGSSAEELRAKVQHYIGEGWEPLGEFQQQPQLIQVAGGIIRR